jgi:hypothetical protein
VILTEQTEKNGGWVNRNAEHDCRQVIHSRWVISIKSAVISTMRYEVMFSRLQTLEGEILDVTLSLEEGIPKRLHSVKTWESNGGSWIGFASDMREILRRECVRSVFREIMG